MRTLPVRPSYLPGVLAVLGLCLLGGAAFADAPAGYYATVDTTNGATLRATLHDVIDDHTKIPYSDAGTDVWNVLELADEDPNDSSRILDLYLNASYQKWGAGNIDYDREHSWPKSYGFPNDGTTNYPYSDCHQLFLCDGSRNGSRGNKPFNTVGASGTEYTTLVNDGVGGGSGVYPGWSNWADPTYWEVWQDRRGDVARAMFYMDVRYEGGLNGNSGATEPDLILTDNLTLIQNSNTGSNEQVAYMGLVSVLMQWHLQDPVDAGEVLRNDIVHGYQGNRNPFVDHPEWADCLFGNGCGGGDVTAPAIPLGLSGAPGDGVSLLDWDDNGEADLAGYSVYRSTMSGGPYVKQNVGLIGVSQFNDTAVLNGSTYYYVVTASDLSGNESGFTGQVSVMPTAAAGGQVAWINEFHYDNASTDVGEFFEIAGTAGTDLTGWSLIGYSGNGGLQYDTVALSGVIPDQQNGFGTKAFAMPGMQNGAPDGLVLADGTGTVIEFISYEGAFTASDGIAAGLQSTDILYSETSTTPAGYSLQLIGTGSGRADFTWTAPKAETRGAPNTGQTFVAVATNQAPTADAGGPYDGEVGVGVAFTSAASFDPDGTLVGWNWDFGDGEGSTVADPVHTYAAKGTYQVVLTVTDDDGAADSDTVSVAVIGPTDVPGAGRLPLAAIATAYPNPFNPATTIRWAIREPGQVRIAVYTVKGELVRTLLDGDHAAGEFSLRWNGTADNGQVVPSGTYFCRIVSGAGHDTRPLLLLK